MNCRLYKTVVPKFKQINYVGYAYFRHLCKKNDYSQHRSKINQLFISKLFKLCSKLFLEGILPY